MVFGLFVIVWSFVSLFVWMYWFICCFVTIRFGLLGFWLLVLIFCLVKDVYLTLVVWCLLSLYGACRFA